MTHRRRHRIEAAKGIMVNILKRYLKCKYQLQTFIRAEKFYESLELINKVVREIDSIPKEHALKALTALKNTFLVHK